MAVENESNGNMTGRYNDWVDTEKGKSFEALTFQVRQFEEGYNSTVTGNSLRGVRQYLNRGLSSLNAWGYLSQTAANQQLGISPNTAKVNFNLTAAAIDTLTAKLANIKVQPQAVTNKSTVKGQRLADEINTILKGVFYNAKVSQKINHGFRGAMIARAEYIHVHIDNGKPCFDAVLQDEVIVDPLDGYYNNPHKMIMRRYVPTHVAIKRWPEFKDQILAATVQGLRQYNTNTYTPCVIVIEAWAKNTYVEKGRHVICIESFSLVDEEWDKDYFPLVRCQYNEAVVGYLGQSVVDELAPIQQEIDRIMITMQSIMKLSSVPRVLIDTNSLVNDNHFTNKVGVIIKYDGKAGVAPIIHNGASMPPELPQQLEFLIQQGFSRIGLSQLDVQGQKPAGILSGDALETLQNSGSERWQKLKQLYEQTHIDVAQVLLNELSEQNIKIPALDRHIGLVEISTKKLPKTANSYVLQVFPSSSLSSDISNRLKQINQMVQMGVLPVSQVPELMQMPDIDDVISKQSAPMKLMDFILEEMESNDEYIPPEPYFDLQYALSASLQKYSMVKMNKGSEKYMALVRRFINDIHSLMKQAQTVMPATAPVPNAPINPQTPSDQGANNNG